MFINPGNFLKWSQYVTGSQLLLITCSSPASGWFSNRLGDSYHPSRAATGPVYPTSILSSFEHALFHWFIAEQTAEFRSHDPLPISSIPARIASIVAPSDRISPDVSPGLPHTCCIMKGRPRFRVALCKYCNKEFKRQEHLERHIRTRTYQISRSTQSPWFRC